MSLTCCEIAWCAVDVGTHVVAGAGSGIDADGALCLDDGKTDDPAFRRHGAPMINRRESVSARRLRDE